MAKPNDHVPKGTHANDRSTELQFEPEVQIFIIRIWLKPREIKGADIEWLGVIEHVPSANRCYFDDLATLKKFIRPYLKNSRSGIWHQCIFAKNLAPLAFPNCR